MRGCAGGALSVALYEEDSLRRWVATQQQERQERLERQQRRRRQRRRMTEWPVAPSAPIHEPAGQGDLLLQDEDMGVGPRMCPCMGGLGMRTDVDAAQQDYCVQPPSTWTLWCYLLRTCHRAKLQPPGGPPPAAAATGTRAAARQDGDQAGGRATQASTAALTCAPLSPFYSTVYHVLPTLCMWFHEWSSKYIVSEHCVREFLNAPAPFQPFLSIRNTRVPQLPSIEVSTEEKRCLRKERRREASTDRATRGSRRPRARRLLLLPRQHPLWPLLRRRLRLPVPLAAGWTCPGAWPHRDAHS